MLAVLVVFIHNNPASTSASAQWVQAFISEGIARCAVPLFFLFAGCLQAKKSDPYPALLKKKAKSLALPYVLWLALAYFFPFNVVKLLVAKLVPQIFEKPDIIPMLEWTAADWAQQFLGYGSIPETAGDVFGPGLALQFWFARDLLIYTALSPAITALLKRAPAATFGVVAALYLLDLPVYFVVTEGLFWYMAGLLWGTRDAPLLQAVDRVKWGEAVFLFVAAFCRARVFYGYEGTSRRLMVIAMCVLMLKASKLIAQSEKAFALAARLSRYSFFLFAIHMLLLNLIKRYWILIFPMKNAFFCLFEYFGVTCVAAGLAVALGAASRKLCPPVFRALNGGR